MKLLKIAFAFALSITCSVAIAASVDFTQQLVDVDGKPMIDDAASKDGAPIKVTLSKVSVIALLSDYRDEQNISPEEKFKRWQLAQKIHDANAAQLSAEDVALIKKLVGKRFAASIVGPVFQIIDPEIAHGAAK